MANGMPNVARRLRSDARRQAITGPTPISRISGRPNATTKKLKNGALTVIFSPVTASEMSGNVTPHSTANARPTNSRLLNRKVASRETSDSMRCSLRSRSMRVISSVVASTRMTAM